MKKQQRLCLIYTTPAFVRIDVYFDQGKFLVTDIVSGIYKEYPIDLYQTGIDFIMNFLQKL